MNPTKLGVKTPRRGLLASLVIAALFASSAQAHPGHVYVNLQLLNLTVAVEALKAITGTLLSTFSFNSKIELHCDEVLVHDGLLLTDGSGVGELLFTNCETLINLALAKTCEPLEPIVAGVKSLLLHHNGDTYILVAPDIGTVFTIAHLGALCPAGQNVQISGSVVAECGLLGGGGSWNHEDCSVQMVEHEFRQVPAGLFPGHNLLFGTRAASLDGDAEVIVDGDHKGNKWGIEALLP
jgi:hypothetical protein